MNRQLTKVMLEMVAYDRGDALRTQHFVKVHNFAATIGVSEQLDDMFLSEKWEIPECD